MNVGTKVTIKTGKDHGYDSLTGEVLRIGGMVAEVYIPKIGGSWCFELRDLEAEKQPVKQFEVGQSYSTRSICDYECIISVTIVKRTKATVTTSDGKTLRIKKQESEWAGAETIYPQGKFSMCPVIRAG